MKRFHQEHHLTAVRTVDLSQPLQPLTDVTGYQQVRLFVTWQSRILGSVDIENQGLAVGLVRLRQAIADTLVTNLLDPDQETTESSRWTNTMAVLAERYRPAETEIEPPDSTQIIDLSRPLRPLTDVTDQAQVTLTIVWQGQALGQVTIANHGHAISVTRLRQAIADNLGLQLLETNQGLGKDGLWSRAITTLTHHYLPQAGERQAERLPADIPVSIVVATYDRPDDLRHCLQSLVAQESPRRIEIVVVDNHPSSGLTPPVVAEFPEVVLIREERQGLAYARNAGFVACTGEIAIATDDDVTMPPDWVERLAAPFARRDVMIVTGNVLPLELETPAQHFFEMYGGLGRGFKRFEVNREWFDSFRFKAVPTWRLGATANAAFRTSIFSHPEIGLMEETLGPGMPSGVGEDTYLFYKVLKAGYTIVYEPEAYVWHKHRRTLEALRRQIYNYSKGGIAYNLTTLFNDRDIRGLVRIVAELPKVYKWRINEWWQGRSEYPMSLLWLEARGNLAGFWGLWQSWRRVKREGRSGPYVPVAQRSRPA